MYKHGIEFEQHPQHTKYLVSKCGNIYSTISNILMKKQVANAYGHLSVKISTKEGIKRLYVHRLVLETYKGACPTTYECNHIDSNPSNNNIANLEWVSRSANQIHAYIHGNAKPSFKPRKKGISDANIKEIQHIMYEVPVDRFAAQSYRDSRGELVRKTARAFNISASTVNRIARREGVYNV